MIKKQSNYTNYTEYKLFSRTHKHGQKLTIWSFNKSQKILKDMNEHIQI